jgi:hypothetical protein
MSTRSIDYGQVGLRDLRVEEQDEKGNVTILSVNGRPVRPSSRFWTSLCAQYSSYGLTPKLFTLFSHAETFGRLSDRLSSDRERLRFAIENNGDSATLLAVSGLEKPCFGYEPALSLVGQYQASTVDYQDGVIISTHTPSRMDDFAIGPDKFSYRYVLETPIDGYGKPLIYLSLLRLVCSNGVVGYARAFRSEINMGKNDDDVSPVLSRALDSFSNEEGYAALRDRYESAANSWASIADTQLIYKVLQRVATSGGFLTDSVSSPLVASLVARHSAAVGVEEEGLAPAAIAVMRAFRQLVGDLASIYDLTTLDALSSKKQAQLSARCTMYDLMNFTTEVATHYCDVKGSQKLQAVIGQLVSTEYDLEGTKEAKPNFQDWFTDLSDSSKLLN